MTLQVRDLRFNSELFDGARDELFKSATCTGPGVSGSYTPDTPFVPASGLPVNVPVQITGDSDTVMGTPVICDVTVLVVDWACGPSVFGFRSCTPTESTTTTRVTRAFPLDGTRPTVSPVASRSPDSNGWYNQPFDIRWNSSDATSGLGAGCVPSTTISGPDNAFGFRQYSCSDVAGNVTQSGFQYRYDATAPTLAPTVTPSAVVLGGSAVAAPGAADALSRVDTSGCDPVDTSRVGVQTVQCTATDRAGNTATASATYSVGLTLTAVPNPRPAVKAGSTLPFKFVATGANGNRIDDATAASLIAGDCALTVWSLNPDTAVEGCPSYDAGSDTFQLDVKTSKQLTGELRLVARFTSSGVVLGQSAAVSYPVK